MSSSWSSYSCVIVIVFCLIVMNDASTFFFETKARHSHQSKGSNGQKGPSTYQTNKIKLISTNNDWWSNMEFEFPQQHHLLKKIFHCETCGEISNLQAKYIMTSMRVYLWLRAKSPDHCRYPTILTCLKCTSFEKDHLKYNFPRVEWIKIFNINAGKERIDI